ncbi:hypothetical protein N0V82_007804 [Gnomoniopsis sp. IMI 355080]|nr:hypothetical protein N0V82_007804 [Gnomoniopsis sp. IMI 355080]
MSIYAPPPSQQNGGRPTYPMMHNPYQQHQQSYATSSAMMPQSSVSSAHPQPIAPAPSPGGRVPPVLRPMPAGGVMPQSGLNSPYAQSPMMGQPSLLQESDQPTHVVGSQGRRGILPSAPGRPAPPAPGSAAAKAQVPQKDADGKFPCPHCTKTYLHAKHLKRHMLRHTGDRPYMCVLCRDTFSRSDILKRHFQKCSIRRGNPTGVSHLSHPAAHVKKSQQAAAKAAQMGHGHDDMNGMHNMHNPNMVPFGLVPAADQMHMANPNDHQAQQLSRSSSNSADDRRSVPAQVMNQSNQQQYSSIPTSMAQQMAPQMANYSMSQNQNGVPMFNGGSNGQQQQQQQQQSGLDWQAMFSQQGGPHHTRSSSVNAYRTDTYTQTARHNLETPRRDGLPDLDTRLFSTWGPPTSKMTYESLSNKIVQFLYPPDVAQQSASFNLYFSPYNVQQFLQNYSHFQAHFSMLHIPTFDVEKVYTGLLAAMCCVGACYSDLVTASHVREFAHFLKTAFERDPRISSLVYGRTQTDSLEELQSLILLHVLLTWNGHSSQRYASHQIFSQIVSLARKADLLRVSTDARVLFSPLHQPDFTVTTFDSLRFDWITFIRQEQRIRTMSTIWLMDVAGGLYFNLPPNIDYKELHIPLPCDDAAYDATNAISCAEALGLHGPTAAKMCNSDGTQRPSQPWLVPAVDALLHSSYQMQTGTTNLTGKFILIHTLLSLVRRAQVEGSLVVKCSPMPQHDWIVGAAQNGHSASLSANNSGRNTPVNDSIPPQTFRALLVALSKFKSSWDEDYIAQFSTSSYLPRRYGFSKDAVPFYWLAQYMLKHTRPSDLNLPSEQRFMQVISLLKSVKSWVRTDGAARGEEMGSVGDIDNNYGLDGLTLDMAKVFRPMPGVVESAATIKLSTGDEQVKSETM